MSWKEKFTPANLKALADPSGKTDEILLRYLPKIRQFFSDKIGPAVTTAVRDDGKMIFLSKSVYSLLPVVVRLAVKEEAFVRFCLTHRDKLLIDSPHDANIPDAITERTSTLPLSPRK